MPLLRRAVNRLRGRLRFQGTQRREKREGRTLGYQASRHLRNDGVIDFLDALLPRRLLGASLHASHGDQLQWDELLECILRSVAGDFLCGLSNPGITGDTVSRLLGMDAKKMGLERMPTVSHGSSVLIPFRVLARFRILETSMDSLYSTCRLFLAPCTHSGVVCVRVGLRAPRVLAIKNKEHHPT